MTRLSLLMPLVLLLASGCCRKPWDAFPMSVRPDRQCQMGTTHGHELYIWDCVGGEHVVIGRYTAEMSCQAPVKETAACGAFTPLEIRYKLDTGAACPPMLSSARWPGG